MKNVLYPFLIAIATVVLVFVAFGRLEQFFTEQLNALIQHPFQFAAASFVILASDIVLPVPSSIVMYINGYVLGPVFGALVSLLSLMASTVTGYYLGQMTSFGLKAKAGEKSNAILAQYGALAIVMTRGIPILSESISIVCGYNSMPFRKYFTLNFIGYLPLCLLYAVCGSIGYDENTFLISFFCSLLISLAFWLFGRFYFMRKKTGAF